MFLCFNRKRALTTSDLIVALCRVGPMVMEHTAPTCQWLSVSVLVNLQRCLGLPRQVLMMSAFNINGLLRWLLPLRPTTTFDSCFSMLRITYIETRWRRDDQHFLFFLGLYGQRIVGFVPSMASVRWVGPHPFLHFSHEHPTKLLDDLFYIHAIIGLER